MAQKKYGFTFVEHSRRVLAEGSSPRVAVGRALNSLAAYTPSRRRDVRDYQLPKGEKLTVIIERLD